MEVSNGSALFCPWCNVPLKEVRPSHDVFGFIALRFVFVLFGLSLR